MIPGGPEGVSEEVALSPAQIDLAVQPAARTRDLVIGRGPAGAVATRGAFPR